jgi:hypothetical protein
LNQQEPPVESEHIQPVVFHPLNILVAEDNSGIKKYKKSFFNLFIKLGNSK